MSRERKSSSFCVHLSEQLWIECAKYLNAENVHNLASTRRSFGYILKNRYLWRCFTKELLSTRPRYRMNKEEEDRLETHPDFSTWFHYYIGLKENNSRNRLNRSTLIANRWFFNYTAQAGSCGKATVQEVEFRGDGLLYFERGYPPMQWSMGGTESIYAEPVREMIHSLMSGRQTFPQGYDQSNTVSKQYIRVADFPIHDVEWNKNRWEWEIKNSNVVIWSVPDKEESAENCGYMPKECHVVET